MGRGQVTIFISLGIVLVILAGIYFFITSNSGLERIDYNEDSLMVNKYVESCLERSAKQALVKLFSNGFYYTLPSESATYEYFVSSGHISPSEKITVSAPFFLSENIIYLPSLSELSDNYAMFIEDSFKECFENSTFPGVSLSYEDLLIKTDVGAVTRVVLDFPITISITDSTQTISKFSYLLNYDIQSKYAFIKDFISNHNFAMVPVGMIADYAYQQSCNFEMIRIGNQDVAFRLYYNDFDMPLVLNFINRY